MQAPDTWYVPREDITPDPKNPRQFRPDDAFAELIESIKTYGIIQPIVLRPALEDEGIDTPWVIVAGERRWRAAKFASVEEVPCVQLAEVTVGGRRGSPSTAKRSSIPTELTSEIALVENIQRQNLTPLEEGRAFRQILDTDTEATATSLSQRLGLSFDYVRKRLAIIALPEDAQEFIADGRLSLAAALCIHALVGHTDDATIVQLASVAARKRWPVAKVEAAVAQTLGEKPRARYTRPAPLDNVPVTPYGQAAPPTSEDAGDEAPAPAPAPPPAAPTSPKNAWTAVTLPAVGEGKTGKFARVLTADGVRAIVVAHRDERTLQLVEDAIKATLNAAKQQEADDGV